MQVNSPGAELKAKISRKDNFSKSVLWCYLPISYFSIGYLLRAGVMRIHSWLLKHQVIATAKNRIPKPSAHGVWFYMGTLIFWPHLRHIICLHLLAWLPSTKNVLVENILKSGIPWAYPTSALRKKCHFHRIWAPLRKIVS